MKSRGWRIRWKNFPRIRSPAPSRATANSSRLEPIEFEQFESVTGEGLRAKRNGGEYRLGGREWFELQRPLAAPKRHRRAAIRRSPDAGFSEVWVEGGDLLGRVILRDDIRPQSAVGRGGIARRRIAHAWC